MWYLIIQNRDGKRIRRTFKTIEGFDRSLVSAEYDRLEILDYGFKNSAGQWVSDRAVAR